MEQLVTVIIPSYNRAHLLKRTLPTYLQENVKEIILVDDCSTDNTEEVVGRLQKTIPQLKYIRQPRNMKQPAANNRGLAEVTTPWVYFGDDDSLLLEGSIKRLLDTCAEYSVDACGAAAYYMVSGEENMDLKEYVSRHTRYASDIKELVDLELFRTNFSYSVNTPLIVPFSHACIVIRSEIAKRVGFDVKYKGNAYREETDFITRCNKSGATIMFDSRAAQINLPHSLATGGAQSFSKFIYHYWMIRNTWRYLNRNYDFLKTKYDLKSTKYKVFFMYIKDQARALLNRIFPCFINNPK